jgi:hypothetical protein
MSDLIEQGTRLIAEGADKFISDIDRANKVLEKNREMLQRSADAARTAGPGVDDLASTFTTLAGVAGGVVVALGAVAVAAGAVAAAVAAAGASINTALNFGAAINDIQTVTGLSAQMAQSVYGASRVSGTSVNTVTSAFANLNERIDKSEQKAGVALGKISTAASDAGKRMARLNEDYAQSVGDINEQLAERIAAINERRVEAEQQLAERLSRINEDYSRTIADGRERLAQRLGDLEESHADRVASINERIAEETTSSADKRANIERNLTEKLEDLNYKAQQDIGRIQADGAKDQARVQEGLQRELASIEQKYGSQRQSLQDKIYNPSTNPILRAYYKTQLKSLDAQQKNERSAAEASYRAKAEQARRETQIAIDAVNERTQRETAIERAAAARKLADLAADSARRIAALQADLAKEDAEYQKQTSRLQAENAKREADARASMERQTADARAAYERQIADAAAAQAKIEAETAKRLEREKQRYDRATQDIADSLTKALSTGGGGGGAAAKAIDPVTDAFNRLGISIAEFQKMTPDEQFNTLNQAVGKLISEGKLQEAYDILSQLFGPAMAGQMLEFFKESQTLRDLGFTQEQIDSLVEFRKKSNEVGLELEMLVAQIGTDLLPIVSEMIAGFQRFWKEHGPEITRVIRDIAQFLSGRLAPAIRDVWNWITLHFIPGVTTAANQLGGAFKRDLDSVTNAFNRDFGPAIESVKTFIGNLFTEVTNLGTTLGALATQISTSVTEAFNSGKTAVEGFLNGIRDIYNFVSTTFNTAIQNLQSTLSGLRPPSIFTPGSPTPFEMGLRGINDAMREINRTGLPAIDASAGVQAALAGGARTPYGMRTDATPAQMAARTINNNRSTSNVANVNVTVGGNADRQAVSDGVYEGLYRAGFVMVS